MASAGQKKADEREEEDGAVRERICCVTEAEKRSGVTEGPSAGLERREIEYRPITEELMPCETGRIVWLTYRKDKRLMVIPRVLVGLGHGHEATSHGILVRHGGYGGHIVRIGRIVDMTVPKEHGE